MNAHAETLKNVGDAASAVTVLATIAGWLPPLAALVTIVYGALRIFEWFERRRRRDLGYRDWPAADE